MKYILCNADYGEECNHREISESEATERMLTGDFKAFTMDQTVFLERKL